MERPKEIAGVEEASEFIAVFELHSIGIVPPDWDSFNEQEALVYAKELWNDLVVDMNESVYLKQRGLLN